MFEKGIDKYKKMRYNRDTKKAGYRIATTIALHRSVTSTPIQPDNRHPKDIITHLFGFCKRFSVDRLFRDEIF